MGSNREKFNNAIPILVKMKFNVAQEIIPHFECNNLIFADFKRKQCHKRG